MTVAVARKEDTSITVAGVTYLVKYTESPVEIDRALALDQPRWITYDTESTGLHLRRDKGFLGAIAWGAYPNAPRKVVYVFPMKPHILNYLPKWSKHTKRVIPHNATFDMHMTANAALDDRLPLKVKNWSDTMALCRLVFTAVSARDGGDSLKLKDIGTKYIDPDADRYEKELKNWMATKNTINLSLLVTVLQTRFGRKGWGVKRVERYVQGKLLIPEEAIPFIEGWRQDYPPVTYEDVPDEILLPYLAVDCILTDLIVAKTLPVVVKKDQVKTLEREERLIPVVYEMARPGIKVDMDYLYASKTKMEQYIERTRKKMWEIAGEKWGQFTVGQHALIKKIYAERLGYEPKSTDKLFLLKQIDKGDELAACITKLRRLEKWLSTYIERIIEMSEWDGRFYSGMNAFNPVSGRFSGDAQQFPKEKIKDENGEEIFYPRRAFLVDEGTKIYYLDYSQVELRVQGHYTMYFGGDLNLCRAYMPYRCTHYKTGEEYDPSTPFTRKRWSELREGAPTDLHWEKALQQGHSAWVNPDTRKPWTPTDVHSSTTLNALPIMGIDVKTLSEDEFKYWRGKGKGFNFMRTYGGGDAMAADMLMIPLSAASALNKGYTEAFPKIIDYQKYVEKRLYEMGFVVNMYGRKYYLSDSRTFYKAANYLIQGSCADMLKEKMIDIYHFLLDNGCKSKMILCVHDELQFSVVAGEDWIIPVIKRMMEDTPDILVPIVAEVEVTETDWGSKKGVLIAA